MSQVRVKILNHQRPRFDDSRGRTFRVMLTLACMLCFPFLASAGTKTWSGVTSTDWNVGSNWTGGVVPISADTANIPGGLTNYPNINNTVNISLILVLVNSAGTGATLTVSSGGALTASGLITVNTGGSFIQTGGTATLAGITSSGIVNVSGGTLTSTVNLTLNSGAVMTQSGGTVHLAINTSTNPTDNLVIASGATLNQSGGTLSIRDYAAGGGTFNQTGATAFSKVFRNWMPGVGSVFNATAGTVEFAGNSTGADFVSGTRQFANVIIEAGVNPANNDTGVTILISGNFTNNNTGLVVPNATFTFNGSGSQTIYSASTGVNSTFGNLVIANTGSTVTLNSHIKVAGNLSISSGTLDLATFSANRASTGGTLTVANNATLRIGGTNTFPTNYSTNTLVVASTVEYCGTNQTVANQLYGNLKLSSSSGAVVKTLPATALTVAGNLTSVVGAGTSVSFTAAANVTVSGGVSLGASTAFSGGSYAHTVGGNWANSGSFNGDTSTITFSGSGASVGGSGAHNFNNLTVTGSGVSFSNHSFSVAGNLATSGSGSFSQASGGSFVMTGTSKTISGAGISIDNLTVSGSVSTSSSLNLKGNLSVGGNLSASGGTITMSGASKTISGAGTKSFSQLYVSGSITTAADFSISSGLTVNGSLTASAGTATFTGTSTLSGTANLYNATINGTSLQLASTSTLGIANALTITTGTLNVTSSIPNTVNFNGSDAQSVNGITYDNLTMSGGNNKTALAGVTVNRDLTIGAGTTFVPGAFAHSIYNDWNNNGSFTAGSSTMQFLGNQTTNITGATTFNVLTVNKTTAATGIILQSNVSASTVNMTQGTMLTGANTITITTTRTGNGIIMGNIQRTHAFTTGVAYAFEGPDNTISFSSVSSVTSVTVSVAKGLVGDFGGSISRVYNIAVPTGTYNATLRLHYEDDELNGNVESSMGLWNYDGTVWFPIGKNSNSTSFNYVDRAGLTNITNRWTIAITSDVALWNGSVSTDWHTAANWTPIQGSPSTPPSATDVALVGFDVFTNQPTISTAVNVKNIVFGSAKAVTLTMSNGGTLNSGSIYGIWNNTTATHTFQTNDQPVTINGNLELGDGVNGRAIDLNIGSGTVAILGSLVQTGGANIVFSGAGNLNIAEAYNYLSGSFTPGTGTVTYNGVSTQVIGAVSYNNLTINKAAGSASINNALTMSGTLTVTAGELDNLSTTTILGNVVIASSATLHNHGVLHIGGNWANSGSYIGGVANVIFDGGGTQTITATTFSNLIINKPVGTSAELTGNIVINGDLTITSGTLNIKSFSCDRSVQGGTITIADLGTFIVGGNNAPANFSSGSLANSSTVIADGTGPQAIYGESFGNLVFRNSGVKTLVAPITVNGDLTIESGATFDGGAQTLTLNGDWINNGTFTPSASMIEFAGIGKTLSGNSTFDLMTVSGSYTALSDFTSSGSINITSTGSLSAGSDRTLTFGGDINSSGAGNIGGTVVLTGTRLQTVSAINSTTMISTLNLNGTVPPAFNVSETPTFGVLNINNTGGINPDTGWNVIVALNIAGGATFNGGDSAHNFMGAVTNNGTMTSSGILNFVPASAATLDFGSSFSSTGLLNFGGTGALTLSGTPGSFHDVTISNTNAAGITPTTDWTLTNNLTVNSGAILNAGSRTFSIGGNILNSGTINSSTSTFILNGAETQDIYSASAFKNLTVNKSANVVTLSSDVTVNGVLNFITGQIQTGSNRLVQPSSGSVAGAGQSTGWVNGNLQKSIPTGSGTKTFEIGGPNNFSPVTTAFSGVSSAGDLTASAVPTDNANIGSSTIDPAKSINRTWTLTNGGVVFSSYDATFNFVAGDVDAGMNTNAVKVGSYSGGSWTYPTIGTKSSTSTQATGLTSFGDFQIGATSSIPSLALLLSVSPNGTVAPHTDLVYTIDFVNNGVGPASAFVITDPIPANTDFKVGSASTSLGSTGLTPAITYSNNGGTTWSYTPASGGGGAPAGYDRNVTNVRWSFGSTLSQTAPNNTGSVTLTARIR